MYSNQNDQQEIYFSKHFTFKRSTIHVASKRAIIYIYNVVQYILSIDVTGSVQIEWTLLLLYLMKPLYIFSEHRHIIIITTCTCILSTTLCFLISSKKNDLCNKDCSIEAGKYQIALLSKNISLKLQ